MTRPILALENATVHYPGSTYPALQDVTVLIHEGERIALTGDNGSGKTTLLHTLIGLRPLRAGRLLHCGNPVKDRQRLLDLRRDVGMVFQQTDEQLFSPTVMDDVAFGPLNIGLTSSEARQRALETLDSLRISSLADRMTHTLSGGQKRMVALATALAMRPRLLLLDEPTNDLDARGRQVLELFLDQAALSLLVVSHDEAFLAGLTTRNIHLDQGRVMSHAGGFSTVPLHSPDAQKA